MILSFGASNQCDYVVGTTASRPETFKSRSRTLSVLVWAFFNPFGILTLPYWQFMEGQTQPSGISANINMSMPDPLRQTNNIKFRFLKKSAMFPTNVAISNKGPFKYYVIMFLTFLGPLTSLMILEWSLRVIMNL